MKINNVNLKDGRVFLFERFEPYTRKNGTLMDLMVFSCKCAKCEIRFEIKTTAPDPTLQSFGKKHCETHKLSKSEVCLLWSEACKKANTKITPEEVATIRTLHASGVAVEDILMLFPLRKSRIYRLLAE